MPYSLNIYKYDIKHDKKYQYYLVLLTFFDYNVTVRFCRVVFML